MTSSVIIEDTRQKAEKHEIKHRGFDREHIELFRSKCPIGDYMLPPAVVIDTKQDVSELSDNLCGSSVERERFEKELQRAHDWGTRLVILIEDDSVTCESDLKGVTIQHPAGYYSSGDDLLKRMAEMRSKYGTEFRFCTKQAAARVIYETLHQYDGL